MRRRASLLVVLSSRALLLDDSRGDAVEVTLAVNRDAAATTGGVLLEDADLLERLENLALDRARRVLSTKESSQRGIFFGDRRSKDGRGGATACCRG